jgi:hypothetical protein
MHDLSNTTKIYTLPFTLEDIKLNPNTVLIAAVNYSKPLSLKLRPGKGMVGVEPDHNFVKQIVAIGEITQAGFKAAVGDFICLPPEASVTLIPLSKTKEDATRQFYYLLDSYNVPISFKTDHLVKDVDYTLSVDKLLG